MSDHLEHLFADYAPILSARDVAQILGLNSKTVYDHLQAGDLPGYHIGSKWIIVRDELVEFISRSANTADRKPIQAPLPLS